MLGAAYTLSWVWEALMCTMRLRYEELLSLGNTYIIQKRVTERWNRCEMEERGRLGLELEGQ